MAIKKAATQKKTPTQAKAAAKHRPPATTVVNVRGSLKAGRDVVMGDQTNTTYNYNPRQVTTIASAAAFKAELQKVRAEIERLKRRPKLPYMHQQSLEVVKGHVDAVIGEAQKPKPLGARINATLTGAKAVMDSLAGDISSAVTLGTALAGLGQIALKLFGH